MNQQLATLGITAAMIAARGLCECEEATELELAETAVDGRQHLLVPAAAAAWRQLKAAALADGVGLFIVSAFRSIDRQFEVLRRKLASDVALEEALSLCAPPGYSEHHTGRAVDISSPGSRALEVEFEQTAAYAWLSRRAAEFGYSLSYPVGNCLGYQYEPWHWCFHEVKTSGS